MSAQRDAQLLGSLPAFIFFTFGHEGFKRALDFSRPMIDSTVARVAPAIGDRAGKMVRGDTGRRCTCFCHDAWIAQRDIDNISFSHSKRDMLICMWNFSWGLYHVVRGFLGAILIISGLFQIYVIICMLMSKNGVRWFARLEVPFHCLDAMMVFSDMALIIWCASISLRFYDSSLPFTVIYLIISRRIDTLPGQFFINGFSLSFAITAAVRFSAVCKDSFRFVAWWMKLE